MAVVNSPNCSKLLFLLGFAQLGMYEVHEKESSLLAAKLSFEASVDLESKQVELLNTPEWSFWKESIVLD